MSANEIKFRKIIDPDYPTTGPEDNEYDVLVDGERVGKVQRGFAAPGYWGAWVGYRQGRKFTSDSRRDVAKMVAAAAQEQER